MHLEKGHAFWCVFFWRGPDFLPCHKAVFALRFWLRNGLQTPAFCSGAIFVSGVWKRGRVVSAHSCTSSSVCERLTFAIHTRLFEERSKALQLCRVRQVNTWTWSSPFISVRGRDDTPTPTVRGIFSWGRLCRISPSCLWALINPLACNSLWRTSTTLPRSKITRLESEGYQPP